MAHLVAEHGRQAGLVLADGQNPRVHDDLAARQAERVDLLAAHHADAPLVLDLPLFHRRRGQPAHDARDLDVGDDDFHRRLLRGERGPEPLQRPRVAVDEHHLLRLQTADVGEDVVALRVRAEVEHLHLRAARHRRGLLVERHHVARLGRAQLPGG